MAGFIKFVSGLYLLLVWGIAAVILIARPGPTPLPAGGELIVLLIAVALALPAAVLFGFGQLVGDVRQMRDDHSTTFE